MCEYEYVRTCLCVCLQLPITQLCHSFVSVAKDAFFAISLSFSLFIMSVSIMHQSV